MEGEEGAPATVAAEERKAPAPAWKRGRPVCLLGGFLGANLLFWFLALTPWRLYHLVSLMLLGVVTMQMMKELVLSRPRGAQLWRSLTDRNQDMEQWMKATGKEIPPEH